MPILPDSVPMTSSANKESKPKKDLDFFSLKSNNQNTDFVLPLLFHLFIPIYYSTQLTIFISFFSYPFLYN